MVANVKLFYRGTCPDNDYIKELEQKFKMHFVKVELEPITESTFTFSSDYISYIICPGNPELTIDDALYCSYSNYRSSVYCKWDYPVLYGTHEISCEKGDYQVLTFSRASVISWLQKKVFNS